MQTLSRKHISAVHPARPPHTAQLGKRLCCVSLKTVCVVMTDVYVENTGSQGSANMCSASGGARAPQGIHGQLAGCSVFNTPLFVLLSCSVIWFGSVSSTLLAGECRMFGRTRFGNRRSRNMLKLVRPCRPSLASTRRTGGVKERNIPHVRAHRFGLGQLLRGRVRPMAGDTPSGYGLTGQSGLVFHVDSDVCTRCARGPRWQCRRGVGASRAVRVGREVSKYTPKYLYTYFLGRDLAARAMGMARARGDRAPRGHRCVRGARPRRAAAPPRRARGTT